MVEADDQDPQDDIDDWTEDEDLDEDLLASPRTVVQMEPEALHAVIRRAVAEGVTDALRGAFWTAAVVFLLWHFRESIWGFSLAVLTSPFWLPAWFRESFPAWLNQHPLARALLAFLYFGAMAGGVIYMVGGLISVVRRKLKKG